MLSRIISAFCLLNTRDSMTTNDNVSVLSIKPNMRVFQTAYCYKNTPFVLLVIGVSVCAGPGLTLLPYSTIPTYFERFRY